MTTEEALDHENVLEDIYLINETLIGNDEDLKKELTPSEMFNISLQVNKNKILIDLVVELRKLNDNFTDLLISKGL